MADANQVTLTVRLWNTHCQRLTWNEDHADGIKKVAATVGAVCGQTDRCPQTIPTHEKGSEITFPLEVPSQELVRIDLEVTYGACDTPLSQPPIMIKTACKDVDMDVVVKDRPAEPTSVVPATVTIQGRLCRHNREFRDQRAPIQLEAVDVKTICTLQAGGAPAPASNKTPAVEKTIHDGIAMVTLPVAGFYEFSVHARGRYTQTCPSMPFGVPVTQGAAINVEICFEAAESYAALLFVDERDKPTIVKDVYRLGDGNPLAIDADGYCQVLADRPVKLISSSHNLRPDTIAAHSGAQIIRAIAKSNGQPQKASGEHSFHIPNLGKKSKAEIRVLKENAQFVTSLTADENGNFSYKPDNPKEVLKYVCYVDGKEHDTIVTSAE